MREASRALNEIVDGKLWCAVNIVLMIISVRYLHRPASPVRQERKVALYIRTINYLLFESRFLRMFVVCAETCFTECELEG